MKRTYQLIFLQSIGLLILFISSIHTNAQQDTVNIKQEKDTLEVYFPGGEIIIIQNKDSSKNASPEITISIPSNKRHKDTNAAIWNGLYWGFTGFMNNNLGFIPNAPYDFIALDLIQSRQIQLNLFEEKIPLYKHKVNLVTGIGLRWNRYRFTNNMIYANANRYPQLPGSTPYIGVIDSSGTLLKSSLNTRSLTVPLLLNYCFNPRERVSKQANLSIGLIGSATYRAFSKTVYSGNPFRKSEKIRDDFGIIPLGLDATVKLRVGKFNLYAEYNLHSLFFKDRGPDIRRFSVGLALLSF